ncbi:MAG: hypothetical protein EBT59_03950 [Betaproteobacteria bacterium]|nr:hypothetical protein [Betaproteobacteria bacterium]
MGGLLHETKGDLQKVQRYPALRSPMPPSHFDVSLAPLQNPSCVCPVESQVIVEAPIGLPRAFVPSDQLELVIGTQHSP